MTDSNCTCGKLDCSNVDCWLGALKRESIKVEALLNIGKKEEEEPPIIKEQSIFDSKKK